MNPIPVTDRDKEMFLKLQTYALLTTRQVRNLQFPGVRNTTVLRRLRKLEAAGLLKRIDGIESTERGWALTERSAAAVTEKPSKFHFPKHSLEHDVKLTALRLTLEGIGIARSWIPEHEIKSKISSQHGVEAARKRTIPDGIMGVEIQDLRYSVAVELELTAKSEKRYCDLFEDYQTKSKIHSLWYVVATPAQGKALSKLWKRQLWRNSKLLFMYSVLDDVFVNGAKALVYRDEESKELGEVWSTQSTHEGAHPLAHRVSSLTQSKNTNQNDLRREEETAISAPHTS